MRTGVLVPEVAAPIKTVHGVGRGAAVGCGLGVGLSLLLGPSRRKRAYGS